MAIVSVRVAEPPTAASAEKASAEKVACAASAALPESDAVSVPISGSDDTAVSVPVTGPKVSGAKVTSITSVPPGGTVADAGETLKAALSAPIDVKVIASLPMLTMLISRVSVCPMNRSEKTMFWAEKKAPACVMIVGRNWFISASARVCCPDVNSVMQKSST